MSAITLAEVFARAKRVRKMEDDPEVAHSEEDALMADVLRACRDGDVAGPAMAHVVVALLEEDRTRWYA